MPQLYSSILSVLAWCDAHSAVVAAVMFLLAYVLQSVRKRYPPVSEPWLSLWLILERCWAFSWDRWGGAWSLGSVSPAFPQELGGVKDGPAQ